MHCRLSRFARSSQRQRVQSSLRRKTSSQPKNRARSKHSLLPKTKQSRSRVTVKSRQARKSAPAPAKLKAAKRGVGDASSAAAAMESEDSEHKNDAAPAKKQLSRITKRHTEHVNKTQSSPGKSSKRRDRPAKDALEAEGEAPPNKKARTTKPKPGKDCSTLEGRHECAHCSTCDLRSWAPAGIWEFIYDKHNNVMIPYRARHDKPQANS